MTSSKRLQCYLIAFGYAAVLFASAILYYQRHLAELQNPVDSAGGMWAFGDLMLDVFVFGMFLVPTFFLLRLMSQADSLYATYSKILLAISLTAPLAVLLLVIFKSNSQPLQDTCFDRLFRSPAVLVILILSRIFGRHHRLKRLITYALGIEGLTLVGCIATFVLLAGAHS